MIDTINLESKIKAELLPFVKHPGEYIGGEFNIIKKDWEQIKVKMAFIFPDTYEIGMSHLGLRILYQATNEHPDYLMERVFAPQVDMEEQMRKLQIPLFSLENYRPVKDFDVIGFTLQYEMSYTNVLNLLDLAGIPVLSAARGEDCPLVIAGGPTAYNPEPLTDFIDLFVIGEGEEVNLELLALYQQKMAHGWSKHEFLMQAAQIQGVYVPSFYTIEYNEDQTIKAVIPQNNAPAVVLKRVIANMDQASFPIKALVPYVQVVHDRMMLELMRGCGRGCRFCQAGIIYRPMREKSLNTLLQQAQDIAAATGYDEMGLLSLSSADYSCIAPLIDGLVELGAKNKVGVSLPSLRVDAFSVGLAGKVQKVRKSGLTFAPEAGSQRMRNIINKGVDEEQILQAAKSAFSQGWTSIKLYFMIGLPGETLEDLDGIVELSKRILSIGKRVKPAYVKKPIRVSVSVASFVPKSHTPFQWYGQDSKESLRTKQNYLHTAFKQIPAASLSYHELSTSILESVFARGGRELNQVLLLAWQKGCKFDSWGEHFKFSQWQAAFEECGLDMEALAAHTFHYEDILPWDHISCGVSKKWLYGEWEKSLTEAITEDCRQGQCNGCGICQSLGVNLDIKA